MSHFANLHSGKLALFQSAVNSVLKKAGERGKGCLIDHPRMRAVARVLEAADRGEDLAAVGGTIEECAKLSWELATARVFGPPQRVTELENELKDSPCDPGWIEAGIAYVGYYLLHKNPQYVGYGDAINRFVYPLPSSDLTVGVLGDWGTGTEVAEAVLNSLMGHKPDLIIHVGDVYYAGTGEENKDNFLDILNAAREKHGPVPVYNLPGNHDYYSGGKPYYSHLAAINAPPHAPPGTPIQEASYFCLRNDRWQLQGMDTGYHDHDLLRVGDDITRLRRTEATWHEDKIQSAAGRKTILFSHHQLFSAFLNIGTKKDGQQNPGNFNAHLYDVFGPFLEQGRLTAWFWGHEHLLEIYAPYKNLDKGRCIGYSAFPELVEADPYRVRYSNVPLQAASGAGDGFIQLGTSDQVYNHGYAVLQLGDPATATATYYQIPGDGSSTQSSEVWHENLCST